MISQRQLFLANLAQTSLSPLALEIDHANGIFLYGVNGKSYIDLISGISVSNTGHSHPHVIKAIKSQLDKHMHLMVYGEYIQSPQVKLAQKITSLLPPNLDSCYFVNSGSEAVEGALKLAKRNTGRTKIISFKNAYHGSTAGPLSVMGDETLKQPFRPLLPGVKFLRFNSVDDLEQIDEETACVIIEPVQAEAGVVLPNNNYLQLIRDRCSKTGSLLIFDEIQTGFGRTGKMFALEKYNVVPDIITIAKAMGGGMPLGAFVASREIMNCLSDNPALGHITTFGGHPVSCAASLASIEVLENENLISQINAKAELIKSKIHSPLIKEIRNAGLLMALEFENEEICKKAIDNCIKNGVITDWFLFNSKSMRIAPPLTITENEIEEACDLINKSLKNIS